MKQLLPVALLAVALGATACKKPAPDAAALDPDKLPSPTGHPRLWLRQADVPRLRGWANARNPLWPVLSTLGANLAKEMDAGTLTSGPGCKDARQIYPCEEAAELFAFLSMVSNEVAVRDDYAARAHRLLMRVIDTANDGPANDPLRDPRFPVDDRSRWSGEALPLVVDWIYPTLTKTEKDKIRDTFLRWSHLLQEARVTTDNHPEPMGVVDDARLVADKQRLRWASNNYFTAHARNLGLMAMALDGEDDPEGQLRVQLALTTGSWLYMIDHLLRGDARGGLPPDGLEYGPQSLAYVTQLLLALHTAKMDDVARNGSQSRLTDNPYWTELVHGWFHVQSPGTIEHAWLGRVHQPAWWGDGQHELTPDAIDLFAPIALADRDGGDGQRAEAIRWLQQELAPGKLVERVARVEQYRQAILYFLLFDPSLPPPKDPRPSLPTSFVAPGIGRLFARSDWSERAAWITFGSGWDSVDHQHGDANSFDFYRNGEWLTKERTGYGQTASASDWHNTLAIENDKPFHAKKNAGDYRARLWETGSQWLFGAAAGDGKLVAHSEEARYVFAVGDATALYNSTEEGTSDVKEATRTLLWIIPDTIVVLDHAVTKTDDRFKRFRLHLPANPTLDHQHATVTTARGQHLFITTLLPREASVTAGALHKSDDAELEPMQAFFSVESRARDVRFLHVLQGADAAAAPAWPTLTEARDDLLALRTGEVLVVLPLVNSVKSPNLTALAPAGIRAVVVTGLAAGAGYDVALPGDGRVHITSGNAVHADGAGVLWWNAR